MRIDDEPEFRNPLAARYVGIAPDDEDMAKGLPPWVVWIFALLIILFSFFMLLAQR